MSPRLFPLLVASALGTVLWATLSVAQRGPSTIPIEDIRPGMRGYGLSVFRGTQPERFDVEVIDVLHNFRPDQDLILAKTPHPLLNHTLAVGGMSGSPIYFDGRLAGAYAYGWQFARDPVVGITPIANMLADMRQPVRPDSFPGARPLGAVRPTKRRAAVDRRSPRLAGSRPYIGEGEPNALAALEAHHARTRRSNPPGLHVAATPVMLGGFTDEVAELMGEQLEPFGLLALQGGGTGQGNANGPARFEDGGAIGVQLIRGDISATAIGTVTHVGRAGSRVIAFGHPMMNAGEIGLPTSTARVLHVFASTARSFKIAEAISPYGTLIHDRQASIVIDTNLQPATIPVTIRLHGVEAPRTEWNVHVASHRALSPMLIFSALANAVKTSAPDETDVMFTARYAAEIEGHGRVALEDRGYMGSGPTDLRALSSLRLFSLFEAAYGNPFVESRITRVELDLEMRFARDVLQIEDVSVATQEVDPGSDVDVRILLRRYARPDVVRTVTVHVPENAAGSTVRVDIQPGNRARDEQPTPRNLADLVESIEDHYPATSIVTALKMPSRGLRFRGHVVRSLPRSALNALRVSSSAGPDQPFITYLRRTVDMGEVVAGSAHIDLNVRETPRGQ